MLRKNIACLLFFMSAATVFAQTTGCRVMDPELQGVYQGACRDGLAEGSGVASLNGKMVDLPVVNRAKTTLQLAAKLGMAEEDLEA